MFFSTEPGRTGRSNRNTQLRRDFADIAIAKLKLFIGIPVFLHQRNPRLTDFRNVGMIIDAAPLPRDAALPSGNFRKVHIHLRNPF
jgi:hypothetical protein